MSVTATERTVTMAQALNDALDLEMGRDQKVIYLGEDVADHAGGGTFKVTAGLSEKYGRHRVRNTPIAEQAIIGAAIGASLAGYRPVAEIMLMDFFAVCMDQVANHAAKLRYMSGGRTNVPITICTVAGGGRQFGAQHSQGLEGWMMHTPGLKVVVPSTAADAKGLFTASIRDDDPCIFVEHMAVLFAPGSVPDGEYVVPLGRADIKRAGSDVSVIAYGRMVPAALAAAETLATEGISVEVVDLRCLVPFDRTTVLESVARTGKALVVHAATRFAGPGAEIAAMISEELWGQLRAPVRRLGAAYTPIPFAAALENATFPDVTSIADTIRKMS